MNQDMEESVVLLSLLQVKVMSLKLNPCSLVEFVLIRETRKAGRRL